MAGTPPPATDGGNTAFLVDSVAQSHRGGIVAPRTAIKPCRHGRPSLSSPLAAFGPLAPVGLINLQSYLRRRPCLCRRSNGLTLEIGGLTTPQAIDLIPGYRGLNLVGADLAEVSPSFDTTGTAANTAANLLFEMLCVLAGVPYR
ncbi:MAG: arginase family protein [Rhodobacteraceae bacterium]|nr:arginase family protein [Paracoccaceae bacterium]